MVDALLVVNVGFPHLSTEEPPVKRRAADITRSALRRRLGIIAHAECPQFSEDKFIGHAAWLDWPWKLHRKEGKEVTFELYNLATHPMEDKDLSLNPEHRERLQTMQRELAKWQLSVTRSLNGEDYSK